MEAIASITYLAELFLDILLDKIMKTKCQGFNSRIDLLILCVRKSSAH